MLSYEVFLIMIARSSHGEYHFAEAGVAGARLAFALPFILTTLY